MNKDFRRNVLTTIGHLVKKIQNLKQCENHSSRQTQFSNVIADVQLLRSDLILILNQNFYLQCKMLQKDKIINELESKYLRLEESSKLDIRMAKMRYQKLLHNVKYELFLQKDAETKQQIAKELASCIQSDFKQYSTVKAEQLPTPKKVINLRNVKSALDNRETLHKHKKKEGVLDQEVVITENFDLESRVGEGIKSQQIAKFDSNFSEERPRSNELNRNQNSNKKKNRGSSTDWKTGEQRQKCKQQQLKWLVSEQSKVPALKQSYFCTDLQ